MGERTDRQGPTPVSDRAKGLPAQPAASTARPFAEGGPAPDLGGFTVMASAQHHEKGDPVPVVHLCIPRAKGVSTRSPQRWVTITADQAATLARELQSAAVAACGQAAEQAAMADPQPEVEP